MPVVLSEEAWARVKRAVEAFERQASGPYSRGRGPSRPSGGPPLLIAKITAEPAPGEYDWTEQAFGADGWADAKDGLVSSTSGKARELAGAKGIPAGTFISLVSIVKASAKGDPEPQWIFFAGGAPAPENPFVLGPESPDAEDADAGTWDRESPPEGADGLEVRQSMREVSKPGGPVYAFDRVWTFDARGCLVSIAEENRRVVDETTTLQP